MTGRPAVFLDRDGTLIEDTGYLSDPDLVQLLPGVGIGLARLHQAGFLMIVVTNQSGLARGWITPEQYQAVADRVAELAARHGGPLTQQYFCPHLPELSGPCECRKPGLLLFQQAITEWKVDPVGSWWVGDKVRDVVGARILGGRALLVSPDTESDEAREASALDIALVPDFETAVSRILAGQRFYGP